jgi:hypothetical protein
MTPKLKHDSSMNKGVTNEKVNRGNRATIVKKEKIYKNSQNVREDVASFLYDRARAIDSAHRAGLEQRHRANCNQ